MLEHVEYNNQIDDILSIYDNKETIILVEDEPSNGTYINKWYPKKNSVRVIVGRFGKICKMSAPKIGITTEGSSPDEAWTNFISEARKRDDAALLTFDIGPTRHEEIVDGLNIPEEEDWSEQLNESEDF